MDTSNKDLWNYRITPWTLAAIGLATFTILAVRCRMKKSLVFYGVRMTRLLDAILIRPVDIGMISLPSIKLLVTLVLLSTVVLVFLFLNQNYALDARRAGIVTVSLLPWMAVMPLKTIPYPLALHITHQHCNILHRWIGRIMFMIATIHMIAFVRIWVKYNIALQRLSSLDVQMGLLVYSALFLIVISSTPFFRHKFFNTFFYPVHVICIIIILVGLLKHVNFTAPYVITVMVLVCVDLLIRAFGIWKWRKFTSYPIKLERLSDSLFRVEIPLQTIVDPRAVYRPHWQPGQHMFLYIPQIGLVQSHPFTIASLPNHIDGSPGYMSFLIRTNGTWTTKLHELSEGTRPQMNVDVFLHGPYGKSLNLHRFDRVLLVVGGVGANFAVPIMEQLHRDGWRGTLHLLWFIKDDDQVRIYQKETTTIINPPVNYTVDIFITRKPSSAPRISLDLQERKAGGAGPTLTYSRTDARMRVQDSLERSERDRMQIFVGGCGNGTLLNCVKLGVADALKSRYMTSHIETYLEGYQY